MLGRLVEQRSGGCAIASQELVSVIIPAYKRAGTIERAVRSALDQTHANIEVVVVDDHSGDDTADIVAAIGDERVTVHVHGENRGGNAARQTAIEHSRGKYLAFLDADDMWYPEKVAAQLERLELAGPGYGMSYTWYESELPDGEIVPARRPTAEGRATPALFRSNFVGTFSTVLVSRAVYDEVGGVDPRLPACQDWEFYLRANQVTGVACVQRTLVRYWRGDHDPTRISSSRERVAAGHAEVYRRIKPRLTDLAAADALAARRNLMETVANQAATADLLTMAIGIPREQWSPSTARFVGHMLVRSVRKRGRASR